MTRLLAIPILLALASSALAQPPAAGPLDGSWLERIESRADRIESRLDAATREQGRIADFFERLSDREGKGLLDRMAARWQERLDHWQAADGPIAHFLDRIGRWGLVIIGAAVLLVMPFGVGYLIRSVRGTA